MKTTLQINGNLLVTTVSATSVAEFNWLTVLQALVNGAEMNENDYGLLRKRSGDWPTCACGQLCKRLSRNSLGEPRDEATKELGIQFFYAVSDRNYRRALNLFQQIEERTTNLLRW